MVKNLPSNAGDTDLSPGQGNQIPHTAGQLGPRATTIEPAHSGACTQQLERPHAATTEAECCGAHAPQLERSLRAATKTPLTAMKYPACCNEDPMGCN